MNFYSAELAYKDDQKERKKKKNEPGNVDISSCHQRLSDKSSSVAKPAFGSADMPMLLAQLGHLTVLL
jgi:hypothetical protein